MNDFVSHLEFSKRLEPWWEKVFSEALGERFRGINWTENEQDRLVDCCVAVDPLPVADMRQARFSDDGDLAITEDDLRGRAATRRCAQQAFFGQSNLRVEVKAQRSANWFRQRNRCVPLEICHRDSDGRFRPGWMWHDRALCDVLAFGYRDGVAVLVRWAGLIWAWRYFRDRWMTEQRLNWTQTRYGSRRWKTRNCWVDVEHLLDELGPYARKVEIEGYDPRTGGPAA